jgi:exopolysaccharide production protein ExoZ
MLVVLFHLGGAIADEKYFGIAAFAVPFSFGNAGVEFFFVLSGFIIFSAHRNDIFKPHRFASYIKKRFLRIYPTYWIIFLSVLFLAIASSALRNTVPHDSFLLLKSLLLIPQDKNVVGGTGSPVLIVAWTLQYEMFFYLCFAFLILSRWLSIFAGIALSVIYIYNTGVSSHSFLLSFLLNDYIFLFIMGMAVSAACTSLKLINNPVFYIVVGTMMFSIVALDTIIDINSLSEWRTLLYGLSSCFIIFGFVQAENKGRAILGYGWMQMLGDSSYALYLIHYPLISILCKFFLLIKLDNFGIVGAMFVYCFIFCLCLISSVIFYLWIEKPIAAYFKNSRTNPVPNAK